MNRDRPGQAASLRGSDKPARTRAAACGRLFDRVAGGALLLVLMVASSGCYTIMDEWDDCTINIRNHLCAECAWIHDRWCHDVCHKADFGFGYKAGYASVTAGGNGCPPP